MTVEDHVSPGLAAALHQDGVNIRREPPRALAPSDADWADLIVAFDPSPIAARGKLTLDWSDTPSFNDRYADAKALLDRRLNALLTAIAAGCIADRTCV